MSKTNLFLLLLISSISVLHIDCKKDESSLISPENKLPDSTSQNFTITTWEYGNGFGSSFAKDVWVFDKNNIWAVGLFSDIDSANPQHYTDANIIRWDGISWKPFNPFIANSSGIKALYALDTSLIYFADGSIIQYKNEEFIFPKLNILWLPGQSIDYVWASSENNVWGVGAWGTVVHYDGTSWKKVTCPDNYHFKAITGSKKTGIAYGTALEAGNNNVQIVQLQQDQLTVIGETVSKAVSAIAINDDSTILLGGIGIDKFNLEKKNITSTSAPTQYYYTSIAKVASNDIYYFAIERSTNISVIIHYNGKRYKVIPFPYTSYCINGGISADEDIAVFSTESANKSLIITLRRN